MGASGHALVSCGASDIHSLQKQSTHNRRTAARNFVISVSEERLAAVVRNFRRRLQKVLDADGAHIEKVFT
jgi:hypothetical protein